MLACLEKCSVVGESPDVLILTLCYKLFPITLLVANVHVDAAV